MKIDSHVHFWDLEYPEKVWIRHKIAALYRSFQPDDLLPLMRATGVEGIVLVQAAPEEEETRYFLDIAEKHEFVRGVVGWVNLEIDRAQVESSLADLMKHPKFKGVRNHPPREFDASWLSDPAVKRGYALLVDKKIPCDFMVTCRQLQQVRTLLMEIPGLVAVINHGGRPFVMAGELEPWASDMRAIARDTAAICKVSGLVERAGQEWTKASLRPWIETLLENFGADRLMFASNWPVMTIMATYESWSRTLAEILDDIGVSTAEREALLGGTATRVYRL